MKLIRKLIPNYKKRDKVAQVMYSLFGNICVYLWWWQLFKLRNFVNDLMSFILSKIPKNKKSKYFKTFCLVLSKLARLRRLTNYINHKWFRIVCHFFEISTIPTDHSSLHMKKMNRLN